ncbi:hypothetical protein GCM10010275_02030 [Streptomyces litmocidini]|nr:hypothetical protein GCM10010275_02030 [Streptomyces litmocidini]
MRSLSAVALPAATPSGSHALAPPSGQAFVGHRQNFATATAAAPSRDPDEPAPPAGPMGDIAPRLGRYGRLMAPLLAPGRAGAVPCPRAGDG